MNKVKKIIRWVIVILIVCLFSGFIFYKIGYTDGSNESIYNKTSAQKDECIDNQNKLKAIQSQISESQDKLNSIKIETNGKTNQNETIASSTAVNNPTLLSAGTYVVGKDINPGTYNIERTEGYGVVSGSNGFSMSQVFGDDGYSVAEYKNAELIQGSKLEVSGTLKIKLISVK